MHDMLTVDESTGAVKDNDIILLPNKFQVLEEEDDDTSMDIRSEPIRHEELGNEKLVQSDSECLSPCKETTRRYKKRMVTSSDRITRTIAKSLAQPNI